MLYVLNTSVEGVWGTPLAFKSMFLLPTRKGRGREKHSHPIEDTLNYGATLSTTSTYPPVANFKGGMYQVFYGVQKRIIYILS